jgi:23S rRNA pseudouridine2605 synthase
MPTERRIGMARALSKLGYCSRSQAFQLIRAGRVSLNGKIRRDPETPVYLGSDQVKVDRQPVQPAAKLYLMLNKPRGYVTTASDEKGRQTVYDLLPPDLPWLGPVGRLDKASEGLLLLTNDSEWAARIAAPQSHLDKTYHVQIASHADETLLARMTRGVTSRAEELSVKSAGIIRQGTKTSWLEITLDEGRNRQLRRIFDELGEAVLRLVRIAIGPLSLGHLAKGASRPISEAEKAAMNVLLFRK